MSRHPRTRRAAWFIALSFALTLVAVVPASAVTPTLTASLSANGVVNGSANAGAQTTFSLQVSSDQGQLQSLRLAAPAGFFVGTVIPSSGNATVSGSSTVSPFVQTINVTGLKISGSDVLTVTFLAWPKCTPGTPNMWTLNGTQKGGAAYAEQPFSTTVNSTSSCKLAFQPIADQKTGDSFTVKVDIVRANNSFDPTYAGQQVSISIEADPGENTATLTCTPTPPGCTQPAGGGTATFSASLNEAGTGYVLEACSPTVNGGVCDPLTGSGGQFLSEAFAVYDDVQPCQAGNSCSAHASALGQVSTLVSANAQEGASIKAGVFAVPGGSSDLSNLDCAGYDEITEVIASFDFTSQVGIKTVADTISADQMKEIANNGVSYLQVCFGSSLPFKDRFNIDAEFDDTLGLYVGLLPDCPTNKKKLADSAPCVVSRQGGGQGTGTITYVAADGDPGGARH